MFPICKCGARFEVRRIYTVDTYSHIVLNGESQGISSTPTIDQRDDTSIEIQCSVCGALPEESGHIIIANPYNKLYPVLILKMDESHAASSNFVQ